MRKDAISSECSSEASRESRGSIFSHKLII